MGLVSEVKKADIFKRETVASNPWLDPKFNKVEALGGEPGFKVDDIPERLGLVSQDQNISEAFIEGVSVLDLKDAPGDYGIKGQFIQTDGEGELSWGWPYWRKSGSTVYYKSGKVAIGHAAPREIFHISKGEETIASRISCKVSPYRQWECLDSDYGFALGIAADDKKFHVHYDTPMGTVSVHLMCFDGDNSRVGILQDSPQVLLHMTGGALRISHSTAAPQLYLWDDADDDYFYMDFYRAGDMVRFRSNTTDDLIVLHKGGVVAIGSNAAPPASMTYGFTIKSGAIPSGEVADQFAFYARDFAIGNACPNFRTENGTVIGLNQSLYTTDQPSFYKITVTTDDAIEATGNDARFLFSGTAGGIGYEDGGSVPRWMLYHAGSNVVQLCNRAANGVVYIKANTSEAGGGGEVTVAEFQDDRLIVYQDIYLDNTKELRFYDNGNYVGFEAPALSANQIWVLPSADGPANEVLGTDNSGNLIWRTHDELAGFVASEHLPALDEDNMASDSDTNVATQQSIKAYVDAGLAATSDEKVGIDSGATAGYLGAASSDGVLRTGASLSYADGGDFVTLNTVQDIQTSASPTFAGLTITDYIYFDKDTEHVMMLGFEAGKNAAGGGTYNAFIGESAGYSLTTGDKNFFCGFEAGYYNETGVENFYSGYQAGKGASGQSHSYNCIIGSEAGLDITTGSNNTFIGRRAGYSNTTGEQIVAIGMGAYLNGVDADYAVFIGYSAGRDTTADYNICIGAEAGLVTTSGGGVVYIGYRAGYSCTTYGENVAIGANALQSNNQHFNVAVGCYAGITCTAAYNNVFIGFCAGYKETAHQNVMIGTNSGYEADAGGKNVYVGDNTAYYNEAGVNNVIIGCMAGFGEYVKAANHYNTMVGYQSGYYMKGALGNTYLGYQSGHDTTTGDYNVCIGYLAADGQITTQSNQLWIANSATATPLIYGEFTNTLLRINAPLDVGRDGALRGALTLWDGAGGNTPGYAKIHSPDGTAWYVFIEDDGTVKIHNAAPAANADGDAIGDQTD